MAFWQQSPGSAKSRFNCILKFPLLLKYSFSLWVTTFKIFYFIFYFFFGRFYHLILFWLPSVTRCVANFTWMHHFLSVCCQSKHIVGKQNKLRTVPLANGPKTRTILGTPFEMNQLKKKKKKEPFDILHGIAINSQIQHGGKCSLTIKNFWQVSATWKEFSLSKPIKVTRHCCRQTNDLCLLLNKTFF